MTDKLRKLYFRSERINLEDVRKECLIGEIYFFLPKAM